MRWTRCRPLLGAFVEITVEAGSERAAGQAMDAAFGAVARVGELMSFHSAASELSQINRAPAGTVVDLHPWTVEVLSLATELCVATAGAFDCAVGHWLTAWGLLPALPHGHAVEPAAHRNGNGSLHDVVILDATRVQVRRPVCLDLGGIAKGYAVDRAIDVLVSEGIVSALVNAGGDLRALGGRAWPIHLRHPRAPGERVYAGALTDGALATSAPYFSIAQSHEATHSALVEPRSGRSITAPRSFTVIAPTCAVADGLTKALAADGALSADCARRYGATEMVL